MIQYKTIAFIATSLLISTMAVLNGLKPKAMEYSATITNKVATFKVDPAQSKLTWLAKKVTGEHTGTIDINTGSLVLDGKVLKGGSFELDTKTITVTDITDKDTNTKLLGFLKGDDFFAVEKFGKATFNITSSTSAGGGKLRGKRKLDD